MGAPGALRVHLLGGLEVEGVPALGLGSRKGRTVLRRLAVAGGPVTEDALLDAAWPDGHPAHPRDQLAVLVSRLRAVVGAERLLRQDAGYRLVPDWVDLDVVTTAARDVPRLPPAQGLAHGLAALRLVRGPLLPEEDAAWADEARSAAAARVRALRGVTAEAALRAGRPHEARELARTCLHEDGYDEAALRLLLEAALLGGDVPAALLAYDRLAQRLGDELGVDPSPETRAAHLRLLQRTAAPATATAPETPPADLPGRTAVLAALLAALDPGRPDLPALHLLTGAAGMGKSTVLAALADRLAATTAVLRVQPDPAGLVVPLQPLLDALADLPLQGPGALLAPLLRPLPGPTTAARALEAGPDRGAVAAAISHALADLGAQRPVLLLVDDGHLLDEASAAVLHHLCRPGSRLPLLVVVAARPGEGPAWSPARHHALAPLSEADAVALVGPERAADLWRRSQGHPLLLAELARSGGELDDDVLAAVARRFSRSPALTEVLRTAAVLGRAVDLDLLAEVLDQPLPAVVDALDAAVAQQLLTATPDGYAFVHDLHREALTRGVTPARTALLHRAAAAGLAARHTSDPGRVGHHALEGGDAELAAGALAAAAEVAAVRWEHEQALAMLDRAVDLAPTPSRRLQRARALVLVGRYADADADALLADTPATRAACGEVRALAAYLRRDTLTALALAREAAAAATDPEQAAGCLTLAARIQLGHGDLDAAEHDLHEALALSTGSVHGIATVWLSLALSMRGDAPQSLTVIHAPAVRQVRALPLVEPHRRMALGRALAMSGRAAEALAAFDALATTVEEQHVRRFAGRAENYRGWVLRNLGASGPALEATQQAWDVVHSLDPVAGAEARGHAVLDLADQALRDGELGTARERLDLAERADLAPHVMRWRFELRRGLLEARWALAVGEADTAEQHAEQVRAAAAGVGVARFVVQSELVRAQARAARGEHPGPLPAPEVVTRVAALESWWLLGAASSVLQAPAYAVAAREQVDALLVGAGPWSDDLRRAARQLLA